MYIMLLKLFYSSLSAVAAGTFNWPMSGHLQNKDELLQNTLSKCPGEMRPGGFYGQQIFWNWHPGAKLLLPGQ